VGDVLSTREEPEVGPAGSSIVIPDGAPEIREPSLDGIQEIGDRRAIGPPPSDSPGRLDLHPDFALHPGQVPEVIGKLDPDAGGIGGPGSAGPGRRGSGSPGPGLSGARVRHDRVCTSTESTRGRSSAMAFQLSPSSAEAYTFPPVVPK